MKSNDLILTMKLTALLILAACMQVSATVYSQKISISVRNAPLEEVLKEIRKQSGYAFLYDISWLQKAEPVSMQVKQAPVEEALQACFSGQPFTYQVLENTIVIKPRPAGPAPSATVARIDTLRGTVTDTTGFPLPGVSVMIKGTTLGTTTDDNGEYILHGVEDDATLVFSMLGFQRQEIPASGRTIIDVVLRVSTAELEAVVVTALGIERSERSLGYATQEVKGDDLTMVKENNVIATLAGKIAGVQVVGSSAASMGGTQKIKIRGVNSITGGGEPLIVVDGTPISNANFAERNGGDYGNLAQDINPEDIESVNVLKGPTASALYGIRGQYGVIMITTRKGAKGSRKVDVRLNSAFTIERTGNFMPMQNLYGAGNTQSWKTLTNSKGEEQKYVQMSWDESWGPKMDGTPVRQFYSFYPQDPQYEQATPFVPYPDNIKDFYETGTNLNNGLSIAGGNENSAYRISFNDTRISGTEPNSRLRKNNISVSGSLDITSKLTVSSNMNFATNKAQRPSQGYYNGSRNLRQWFQRNVDMTRLENYRYPDGTFLHWNINEPDASTGQVGDLSPVYWNNPYFEAYENINEDSRDRLFGDVGLQYQVLPELSLSGFVRGDMYTQNIETREAFGSWATPEYTVGKYQNREWNFEFLGTYDKTWGEFSLNANLGANLYTRRYNYLYMATAGGLSSPGYYNIDASIDRPSTTSYLLRKEIRSFYAMASFGYRDIYFIDASLRNDISSALPPDNNSYWYPSVSGSLILSELLEFNDATFVKLRASYAQAGSDLDPYSISQDFVKGGIYSSINTVYESDVLANPNIKPAFAHSYEVGTDLRFFNDRLGLDFTYYEQRNKNQIINLDISGTSGYNSTRINAGLIENKGIELTLTAVPVQGRNFNWNTTFNLNRNRNKVVELASGTNVYTHASNRYSSVNMYLNSYVGESFGSLIGKAYRRDEETGKILLDGTLVEENGELVPGSTYGQPLYTGADHNFGTALPDFTGGFYNTFRLFDKVEVGAMIDFQFGGQFFSWSEMLAVKTGLAERTAALNDKGMNVRDPVEEGGGVRVEGVLETTGEEVAVYLNARTYYRNILGTHVYEEWLNDASYIKLREVRLGYSFDSKFLNKTPFSSMSLALIARNPLQIWQRAAKGLDPAELSVGNDSISWLETGNLNTVRSFGLNLNVTF